MTVYYPQSSMFLVLQLVGMSEKKNKREKKEGGLGRDGCFLSLPVFSVCLFVCLFRACFSFRPTPLTENLKQVSQTYLKRVKRNTTINFFLETEKNEESNKYNQFKRNKPALF